MSRERSPVRWARWGSAGRLVGRLRPPQKPSVLILSLPRSGSSWVGDTLGRATDALYLREPINQVLRLRGETDALVSVDAGAPPAEFESVADRAFSGFPDFSPNVVRFPRQWRLTERTGKRLVIKEVYPGACDYFCRRYQPRLIFLIRHPAAVTLSFIDRGWWSPDQNGWQKLGARQGRILQDAQNCLAAYPNSRVVLYEELCVDPMKCFQELFAFAGLAWDTSVEAHVANSTAGGDTSDPYGTSRLSQAMERAWMEKIAPEALQGLRAGYEAFGLPWYSSVRDWHREGQEQ